MLASAWRLDSPHKGVPGQGGGSWLPGRWPLKALLLQFAGPGRLRQLGLLARIPAEWWVAEPRWPHFRDQIDRVRPDLIVLDLSKHPTHGIDTADYLRKTPATAALPIYALNATEAAARKLAARVPGVPILSLDELCDRLMLPT